MRRLKLLSRGLVPVFLTMAIAIAIYAGLQQPAPTYTTIEQVPVDNRRQAVVTIHMLPEYDGMNPLDASKYKLARSLSAQLHTFMQDKYQAVLPTPSGVEYYRIDLRNVERTGNTLVLKSTYGVEVVIDDPTIRHLIILLNRITLDIKDIEKENT